MLGGKAKRLATLCATTTVMLLAASAGVASAAARMRFVDADPAGAPAQLTVLGVGTNVQADAGGQSAFGVMTPYASVPSGAVRLTLVAPRVQGSLQTQLSDGASYTVVATGGPRHAVLRVYRDGAATAARARLRVIHAAPELGAPDISLGSRPIAQDVSFGSNTGYIDVAPGAYTLSIRSPHGGRAVASGHVVASAGVATTAIVVGTGGQPVRVVSAQDAAVTPAGPPETGLGGLARGGGRSWLAVVAAMFAGGALGAALYLTARRRRSS